MTKPNRLTLFINPRDPDGEEYLRMAMQTKIPFFPIPVQDCSAIWLRYEDRRYGSPIYYGPSAIKHCLESLSR